MSALRFPSLASAGVMSRILRDASGLACGEERPEGRGARVGGLIRSIKSVRSGSIGRLQQLADRGGQADAIELIRSLPAQIVSIADRVARLRISA